MVMVALPATGNTEAIAFFSFPKILSQALNFAARLPAQPAISGMYAGTQSLLLCDAAQQSIELAALVRIESGANSIIVLAGNAANLFRCVSAKRGQMQRIRPPVRRILTAFDQTSFLKFVQ
jgi:hypothetical protein